MKILIDMLTPKQVLFLGELSNRLEDAGHKLVRVTRDFGETIKLLHIQKMKAQIIGTYKLTMEGKLQESLRRTARLAKLLKTLKIDSVVAYPSVEASRAAFGLSIPYFCISDSPHAEAVSRLSIPLATKLFSPAVIPKEDWTRYGIDPSDIIQYNALDPYVWIKDAKPDPQMLRKLGLDSDSKIVTLRVEESFAAYLMNKTGEWKNLAVKISEELLKRHCEAKIIILPRYRTQYRKFIKFKHKVIIPKFIVYGASLLASTSIFIGGGGTMTAEAAMMGIPTISYFPAGPTRVESFLEDRGLLTRIQDPASIAEHAINWINDGAHHSECRRRAQALLEGMEDPIEKIVNNITHYKSSSL